MKTTLALARRMFFLWFGAIWTVAGLAAFLTGMAEIRQLLAFRHSGRVAEARIFRKEMLPAGQNRSRTSYRVTFRFRTESGETVESFAEVGVARWEAAREGDALELEYLADAPRTTRLPGESKSVAFLIPLTLGGLAGGVGTALVIVNLQRLHRLHHLFLNGTAAEGRVTQIRSSHYKSGSVHLRRIYYEYTASDGCTYQGKSLPMHSRETDRWAEGDAATIRYDPAKPGESAWIEY